MASNVPEKATNSLEQLAAIAERHDSKVRLLFQLRNYISLVKFDPKSAKADKSAEFKRFITKNKLDLWDTLQAHVDTRKTKKKVSSVQREVEKIQDSLRLALLSTKVKEPSTQKRNGKKDTVNGKGDISNGKKDPLSNKNAQDKAKIFEVSQSADNSNRTKRKHADIAVPHGRDIWQIDPDLGMPDDPSILNHVASAAVRTSKRFKRSPKITNPWHHVTPAFGGNIDKLLNSYRTLTDDNEPVSADIWEKRVASDAEALRRVLVAKLEGKLGEIEFWTQQAKIPKFLPPPQTRPSYYDSLLQHAIHYSRQRSNLRKFHQSIVKRNTQSVEQYFRRLSGAEDKERKELERQVKQIARKTGQEVLKKWKLAEKIVEQRRQALLDEEKREQGKVYLNQILDNSAKLIERRIGDVEDGTNITENDTDVTDGDEDSGEDFEQESIVVDDTRDDQLTSEELKLKYANLPDLSSSEDSEDGDENSESEQDDSSASEKTNESDLEPPSEEALRLYAGAVEEGTESSGSSSDATDSDTSSEITEEEDEEDAERPGLSSLLFGNFAEDGGSDKSDYEEQNESALSSAEGNNESLIDGAKDNEMSENSDAKEKQEHAINGIVKPVHKIKPPILLHGQLREYQRNGLDWLAGLVQSGTNGILADEMGLGKTIQTIALLSWLACEKHIWGPHLIVVPTSVMLNWELEFKRFAPGLKILTYFGTPQQRKRKRRGWNKEDTWHVCITSYQLVIQDQVVFRGKRWQYMVLDEAHNIKNFRSQRWQALLNFNAQHRLLLTGTPLQNNLVELWSLLYFLMPSSRATQMMPAGFASLDDFQEWFAKPVDQMVEEGEEADDEARATITKLHQVLRPYLLRRLKADVEKQMPGKYEHVVYCRLSKRQRYLYDDFMSRASTRATLESGNFMSILNCLMQLRKVCNHPNLFEVRPIVTSYTLDKGVWTDFGLVSPKFNFKLENTWNIVAKMEHESKLISMRRHELSANKILEDELAFLTEEVENDCNNDLDVQSIEGWAKYALYLRRIARVERQQRQLRLNKKNTSFSPLFGTDCIELLRVVKQPLTGVSSYLEREEAMRDVIDRFACVTPIVVTLNYPETIIGPEIASQVYSSNFSSSPVFHMPQVKLSIAFPDKRLLQYDCGKLQKLAVLLHTLISQGHRCLIFTQMTKVLDILEQFLNLHGWRYLRLDGATRIEQRQALTERFNNDDQIPVFILSTRSGGLGINLTGADTVIFYDSDWNPAMDKQCQDRCHRIGQTRDVHIYRLVSEFTIESNILRKATQKTILDNVVIQEGSFTTDYFNKMSVQDILGNDAGRNTAVPSLGELEPENPKQFEAAMALAEDKDDQLAANLAMSEARMDQEEFSESLNGGTRSHSQEVLASGSPVAVQNVDSMSPNDTNLTPDSRLNSTPVESFPQEQADLKSPQLNEPAELEIGHIDDWMIKAIERGILV